ncbi:MAG: hypothetical protein HYX90_04430 [Chloroflexi bacterium]|nr:hypothetical protein [Chloroflexota bacterium]
MARVYAKFLPKFLPGKPTVIVRGIPAAQGTVALNYAYAAKPDGLTLAISSGSPLLAQMLGLSIVKYDWTKMTSMVHLVEGNVYFTWVGTIDKREDILKAKGLVFGHSPGKNGFGFVIGKEVLGIPVEKITLAYGSSGDASRAFMSKEINVTGGTAADYNSFLAPLVAKKELLMLFQTGYVDATGNLKKDPGYPDEIPTIQELYQRLYGKAPSGITWDTLKAVYGAGGTTKGLFLPPGTPDNIVRTYWDAVERMLADRDFQENNLQEKTARWLVGEEGDKAFKAGYSMRPQLLAHLKEKLAAVGVVTE